MSNLIQDTFDAVEAKQKPQEKQPGDDKKAVPWEQFVMEVSWWMQEFNKAKHYQPEKL